jgi:hypothetical protein
MELVVGVRNPKNSALVYIWLTTLFQSSEPHVGLEVCWQGYERVPKHMRDRLNELTGAPDRFIGGSADTVYIPGHLRDSFLHVLGLFLDTDCFLEIVGHPPFL